MMLTHRSYLVTLASHTNSHVINEWEFFRLWLQHLGSENTTPTGHIAAQ